MKIKNRLNYLYIILWILPLLIFARDFFFIEDLAKEINTSNIKLIWMSAKQGIFTVILSFLVAILPAYFVTYERGRVAALVEGTLFIPFFFPIISTIVSFSLIFSSEYLRSFDILYTLKAILIANVFYNAPIFVKYLSQGMKRIPKEIIEASYECGSTKIEVFRYIKLPLILPQLMRATFLVFVYSFTSFGIVLSLGGLRYSTLEVEISNILMGSLDFSRVFALGIIQFLILTTINILIERCENYELKGDGVEESVGTTTRIVTYLYLIFEWLIVSTSVVFSFYNYYERQFSFKTIVKILSKEFNSNFPVIEGIRNSLFLAGGSAIIVVGFTYILLRNYNKLTSYIIFATFGISGAFLAICLVYINILYDTSYILLLILGYFLTSVPLAYSFMYQYVRRFPQDVIEASKVDGASTLERFFFIELPMLKDILISTTMQIFAILYAEFTITYTMQIGSRIPLSSLVNYSLNSNKLFLEGSAMSTLNILIIGGLFTLSTIIQRKN